MATDLQLYREKCSACPIRHRAVCATCEPDELARLEAIKSYKVHRAGATIALEGDALPFAASVVSGCATLSRSLEDGRRQMVGLLMPSDFIGRPGHSTAAYEITAATDVTLCQFRRMEFEDLLASTPHLASRLLQMSLDELDAAREWMLLLGRKTAREKVASLLLIIVRRASPGPGPKSIELPLTREAMADYLGLTNETVSRQLTALRKDGIIGLTGKRGLTCDDLAALFDAAGEDGDGAILT
ncbi:transcriptional regulator FnrL [Jannaschia aquimarina]|nr:Crp/Fnr family transcriptional regulator [Jannaschia aquimarina]